jgi:hypothetical protein
MEILIQLQVQWDVTVAIFRRDGELFVTPYLGDPDPGDEALTEEMHVLWRTPLVVGGRLPADVVDVAARETEWEAVHTADGVWLAHAHDGDSPRRWPGSRSSTAPEPHGRSPSSRHRHLLWSSTTPGAPTRARWLARSPMTPRSIRRPGRCSAP